MRQVLQGAATAAAGMRAGRLAAQRRRGQHALAARLHHLGAGGQHACLDLLAGQRTGDEPAAPLDEGDAATVVGQTLDGELLLLANRHLGLALTTSWLEAQGFVLGHVG